MKVRLSWRATSAVFLGLLLVSCGVPSSRPPTAVGGVIDLDGWDFNAEGAVPLSGVWRFFPDSRALDSTGGFSENLRVPGFWNGRPDGSGGRLGDHGVAVYRLLITGLAAGTPLALSLQEATSAYRIYLLPETSGGVVPPGKAPLMANGVIGPTPETTIAQYLPRTVSFQPESADLYLVAEVANFATREGGLTSAIVLETPEQAAGAREAADIRSFFSLGVILFMAAHYLIFFVTRRRDRSALLFALFSLGVGVRLLVTERLPVVWWFPEPSRIVFGLTNKIEFLSVYLLLPLFYHFLATVYPRQFPRLLRRVLWVVGGASGLLTAVFPLDVYVHLILYYQLLIVAVGVFVVVGIVRAAAAAEAGALIGLIGFVIFFSAVINDVLSSDGILQTPFLLQYGFLAFIVAQSFLLSVNYDRAMDYAESLNKSLFRFVPREFIHYLGKGSILDVNLGDATEQNMSVLFADIRSFTTLSEGMSPEESFRFLNSYLERVGPIIRQSNGFIDKYIGDGIMALFPRQPEDAVVCGVEMLKAVSLYNQHRARSGYVPIRIGIGIHTGSLVLGTIGENERLNGTVIADAVNVSSRLEGLNKVFGSSLIVTAEIINSLKSPEQYFFRMLGGNEVRGRRGQIMIYEILVPEATKNIEVKRQTKEGFEEGIRLYGERNFLEAGRCFHELLKRDREDAAAAYYLDRCEELMRLSAGLPKS